MKIERTKLRRKHLACERCSRRKIKCDKQVPCANCIKKGLGNKCRRKIDADDLVDKLSEFPITSEIDGGHTSDKNGQFNNASIENYMNSLQSLTFGYSHMNGLVAPEFGWMEGEDPMGLIDLTQKIDFNVSFQLCSFACRYITFLHFGIVDRLFMADHAAFWGNHRGSLEALLSRKEANARDFNFWMSQYYIILCIGMYFGLENLRHGLPFTEQEEMMVPRVCFHASLDHLRRTAFLEKPDIRTIQIYCAMTTCLHGLGNVYLHKQLLAIVVGIAKTLRLDLIKDSPEEPVNFHKEISKRLWYSFFMVDSLSNVPHRLIGEFSTPFPRLLTTDELLGIPVSSEAIMSVFNASDGSSVMRPTSPEGKDDIAGLRYQRIMCQMAQIKQDSYTHRKNLHKVTQAWCQMRDLRGELDEFFGSAPFDINDLRIAQFAKFLLFSSLTKEGIGLGSRLLTLIGREAWYKNFREETVSLAVELVKHNAMTKAQPYYKRYWIVGQHLVSSCLFLLLDMLMFSKEDCEKRLKVVEEAIPHVKKLQLTHSTIRVGVAVLEKMFKLVSAVRLQGTEFIRDFSLRGFLKELEVANPHSSAEDLAYIPPITESQYLRHGINEVTTPVVPPVDMEWAPELSSANNRNIFDPELENVLDDTGWYEFLDFFFGSQNRD